VSDTREKLQESKYFLESMTETQSDRDAFKYNLSAFLAAVRSVTLIMQTEYGGVPGFKKWWAEKQDTMRSDGAMRLLNEKRRMTVHVQPVRPHAKVNVSITEHITISDSASIVITHADGTVERQESEPEPKPSSVPPRTETTTEWLWYFDELPEKDIVVVCKEHISKLDALVEECESRFAL
jgi:hypothetical protein